MPFAQSNTAIRQDHVFDADPPAREFDFSDADFSMLSQFAYDSAGISLASSKRNLVYGRLSRRLRALGIGSFAEYRSRLTTDRSEVQRFINAISTNLTKFFREAHHFQHLEQAIIRPLSALPKNASSKLRIWSAGCSTGEEPYSAAAILCRHIPDAARRDMRILATDIDTEVLAAAARGEYPAASVNDVPPGFRSMFEAPSDRSSAEKVQVADGLRDLIRFRRLNLIEDWPFRGLFDVIFCRNVMIYFDAPTKARLLERFAERIKPGGWLYIGHSESLTRQHPLLELEGKTIYRRRG
ncbi:MAG: protein-glutamate O-methyltransferase CheR [Xanthobacteraceae bacterium]